MPDIKKIDLLLQYILAVAGQEDDFRNRDLGPIHLIKYLYLADLAYSEYMQGNTFTGLAWRFHHYGPWAVESYNRIEPALLEIEAEKKIISSTKYEDDIIRWSVQNERLCDELCEKLHFILTGSITQNVHKFGSDTTSLLHHVYKTKPMLKASPGELLDFTPPESMVFDQEALVTEVISVRQQKKRKEKILAFKKRIKMKLEKRKEEKRFVPTPPRYDEIFFEGVKHLDRLAGKPIEPVEGKLIISDGIWKSKARTEIDLP